MRRLEGSHLLSEEVTEEVMVFAGNMTSHPETWHDFPLFNEFEDTNDFEMSDAQQEHAMAVVSLEPRLAALRIELCPTHMSEGCFWKIYFILLHSRLNKHDTELLSTPQIAEARAMLLQMLQTRTKPGAYLETDKHAVQTTEDEIIDKSVNKEEPATQPQNNYLLGNFSEINHS